MGSRACSVGGNNDCDSLFPRRPSLTRRRPSIVDPSEVIESVAEARTRRPSLIENEFEISSTEEAGLFPPLAVAPTFEDDMSAVDPNAKLDGVKVPRRPSLIETAVDGFHITANMYSSVRHMNGTNDSTGVAPAAADVSTATVKAVDGSERKNKSTEAESEKVVKDVKNNSNGDHDEELVWYFAFGSNLNPTVFGPEAKTRSCLPREKRVGYVPGWGLRCNLRGFPFTEPGMGNLIQLDNDGITKNDNKSASNGNAGDKSDPCCVHGVAYLITRSELDKIYLSEGGGASGPYKLQPLNMVEYSPIERESSDNETPGDTNNINKGDDALKTTENLSTKVPTSDEKNKNKTPLVVYACYCPPESPFCHPPYTKGLLDTPSQRYLNLLRDGAVHHGLEPKYSQFLDNYPVANPVGKLQSKLYYICVVLPLMSPAICLLITGTLMDRLSNKLSQTTKEGRFGQILKTMGMIPKTIAAKHFNFVILTLWGWYDGNLKYVVPSLGIATTGLAWLMGQFL